MSKSPKNRSSDTEQTQRADRAERNDRADRAERPERTERSPRSARSAESIEMQERAREAVTRRTKKVKPFHEKYAYHLVIGAFVLILVYGLANSLFKGGPNVNTTFVNDESLISLRNSGDSSFKVAANPVFNDYKLADAKLLFNTQATNKQQLYRCSSSEKASIIPERYSFREAHPECARPIATQGNCSSSYSIAPVSAINDRLCLQNKEDFPILSYQTPIACDKSINKQCKGGFVSRTLDYAKVYGLVDDNCLPYDVSQVEKTTDCTAITKECQRYKISDYCVSSTEEGIKQEIFNHGPIVAVIPVYRDFLIYKEGVYQIYPKNQRFQSGHAIKLIGWDEIDGRKCWLVENSWGEEWGVKGTGCILIGQEQLDIERFALAPALIPTTKDEEATATEEKENVDLDSETVDIQEEQPTQQQM